MSYESIDVLQDMDIRQAAKTFSDWLAIPRLYVKGEFLGGSDIMMEMLRRVNYGIIPVKRDKVA